MSSIEFLRSTGSSIGVSSVDRNRNILSQRLRTGTRDRC
jgi:hypothetical protein